MLPTEPLSPPDSLLTGWEAPALVFTPTLELRSRIQLSGQGLAADERQIAQLVRMGMLAERGPVQAGASLEIVRSWQQVQGLNVVSGGFFPSLADGWISVSGVLSESVQGQVTVGRQSLFLHEGRLVGADTFDLNGLYLDALVAQLELSPFHVQYINARRFGEPESDPLGLGVNIIQAGVQNELANLAWIADGVWVVDARHTNVTTYTGGLYGKVSAGRFGFRGESYWQASLQSDEPDLAALLALQFSWIFGQNERVKVQLEGELAEPGWERVLGGTRDFWGFVDIFSDPELVRAQGMRKLALGSIFHPVASFSIGGKAHRFAHGTEADASSTWFLSPMVTLEAGGGYFWSDSGYSVSSQGIGWIELDAKF